MSGDVVKGFIQTDIVQRSKTCKTKCDSVLTYLSSIMYNTDKSEKRFTLIFKGLLYIFCRLNTF